MDERIRVYEDDFGRLRDERGRVCRKIRRVTIVNLETCMIVQVSDYYCCFYRQLVWKVL